jgi:hypothetical protein
MMPRFHTSNGIHVQRSKRRVSWVWSMEGSSTVLMVSFHHLKLTMILRRRAFHTAWSLTAERRGWASGNPDSTGEMSFRTLHDRMREVHGEAVCRAFAGVE